MYQIDKYYLMHKNIKVALFEMSNYGTEIKVLEVYNKTHMPYGTHVSDRALNEKFAEWKNNRMVPVERPYLMQVYKKTGKSIPELETLNLGLSMCDCYWYEPIDKNYDWNKINFFDNGFVTEIGKMLINTTLNTPQSIKTPDMTLSGECPKMWTIFDNTLYLVKGCRVYDKKKEEIANEVFASLIASKLGINTMEYYLLRSNGISDFCCTTNFVKNSSTDFVTFEQLSKDTSTLGKNGVLKFLQEHNQQKYINEMLVIDYIVGNYNRTLHDIGFLVNADTMEFINTVPLFDYEESMDIEVEDTDITGVFVDDFTKQMEMITDYSWVDFQAINEALNEITKIYKNCGFSNEEIAELLEYIKKRILNLRKLIPAKQLMKVRRTIKHKPKEKPKDVLKKMKKQEIVIHQSEEIVPDIKREIDKDALDEN